MAELSFIVPVTGLNRQQGINFY